MATEQHVVKGVTDTTQTGLAELAQRGDHRDLKHVLPVEVEDTQLVVCAFASSI